MQNKYVSLVVGFVITMVVVIVLVVFLGKASVQPTVATDTSTAQQAAITDIKGKTDGLVNYGDLPKIVTKDDIERSNPFDSY